MFILRIECVCAQTSICTTVWISCRLIPLNYWPWRSRVTFFLFLYNLLPSITLDSFAPFILSVFATALFLSLTTFATLSSVNLFRFYSFKLITTIITMPLSAQFSEVVVVQFFSFVFIIEFCMRAQSAHSTW